REIGPASLQVPGSSGTGSADGVSDAAYATSNPANSSGTHVGSSSARRRYAAASRLQPVGTASGAACPFIGWPNVTAATRPQLECGATAHLVSSGPPTEPHLGVFGSRCGGEAAVEERTTAAVARRARRRRIDDGRHRRSLLSGLDRGGI